MKTTGLNSEMRRDRPCFNCQNGITATGDWFIKCSVEGEISKYEYHKCLLFKAKN